MSFIESPFVAELVACAKELAHTDWCEGGAGNLSLLLRRSEVEPWLVGTPSPGTASLSYSTSHTASSRDGFFLLITAAGTRLKHLTPSPDTLALLELPGYSRSSEEPERLLETRLTWGLQGGGRPSSELAVHILGHRALIRATGSSRALLHCHPPYCTALSIAMQPVRKEQLNSTLWGWHSEGLTYFPEGVGLVAESQTLPPSSLMGARVTNYALPGSELLAELNALELAKHPLVFWQRHGVIAAGATFAAAFDLVEVAESIIKTGLLASQMRFLAKPQAHNTIFPPNLLEETRMLESVNILRAQRDRDDRDRERDKPR